MPITENDIREQIKQSLGREATQAEINSFMQYANNGSVSLTPFDVGQILQGTPEYQNTMLGKQGGQFNELISQGDNRLLGNAQGMLTSQFAQQGRSIGNSGYLNAFAQAAANIAQAKQQQLASFYGGGFGEIRQNAAGQGNTAQQFGRSQQESSLDRSREIEDYYRMQNDYNTSMSSQRRRERVGAFGSIVGGAIGAYGGPVGAIAGSKIGGSLGGLFG